MYKIAICDDNPADIKLLSEYLKDLNDTYQIETTTFQDGIHLARSYKKKGQYDLILLDMIMGHMNGIETARKIRVVDEDVTILIITATVEYAIEGYKINAARYIVKPIERTEFIKLARHIFASLDKKKGVQFSIPGNNGTTAVPLDDIFFFESDIRSIHVVCRQGSYTFTGKISRLEEQMTPHGFLRIHKSFIVNLKHVHSIQKDSILLDNQSTLPLSSHRHKEVSRTYLSFMEEQLL